jgi:hypothetical protein
MNDQFLAFCLMNRLAFYLMLVAGLLFVTKPVQATKTSIIHSISDQNFSTTNEVDLNEIDPEFSSNIVFNSEILAYSFPTFNSSILDQQLQRYLQYVELVGPPDILIVGSSRAFQGVDPLALRDALAAQGKPGLKIFNFGINGATAQVVDILLRDILTPAQLPRMIVWADGVRAFNSGRIDRTYNSILSSPGYQKIATGSRPNPPVPTTPTPATRPPATTPSQPPSRLPSGGGFRIDPINFLPNIPSKNQEIAVENQPIFPILVASNDQGNLITDSPVDLAQYRRALPNPQPNSNSLNDQINNPVALGFNPVSNRFNPNTYYQQYRRIPGQYDGDYAAFTLEGKQLTALLAVADFTRANRIPLLVVNLPLTNDYLDSVRFNYEQQFRQFMWRTAGQNNFMFRDLSGRWLSQHDYFADPSHLNRFGAIAVSQQLAQDRTLPWPNAR